MIDVARCIVDEYVHSSKLKNFCALHGMNVNVNKIDLLNNILEYAGDDVKSCEYKETYQWFLDTIKEGSKEFCYKRIYISDEFIENVEDEINKKYPKCPQKDILTYQNTDKFELVNYKLERNDQGDLEKISFLFSKLLLEGNIEGEKGLTIIYPVYIDIYVKEGFIVSREKAKTTLFKRSEHNIIYKNNYFKTQKEAIKIMEEIVNGFKWQWMDINPKQKIYKMLFRLYERFAFTPADILDKVGGMKQLSMSYVENVFSQLELRPENIQKAVKDINIFLEKYISINGDMESIFKNDRKAYLIKISSDDAMQLTRIDTSSSKGKPLQCTDAFFDGKKSILNSKECRILNLCYNRKKMYLGDYTALFSVYNEWGIIKTRYFPEEDDIQDVLQTIFENY